MEKYGRTNTGRLSTVPAHLTDLMSLRENNSHKEQETSMYDDALPLALKNKGIAPAIKADVKIHRHSAPVSPYIIHLSHEEETSKKQVLPATSKDASLDALEQQLLASAFDFESSEEENTDLELDFQDMVHQLRENDAQIQPLRLPKESFISARTLDEPSFAPVTEEVPIALNIITEHEGEELSQLLEEGELTDQVVELEEAVEAARTRRKFTLPRLRYPAFMSIRLQAAVSFAVVALILVLPLHAMQEFATASDTEEQVTSASVAAVDQFMRATQALESERLDVAATDFERASTHFAQAEEALESMNLAISALVNIIPETDRTLDSASGLIQAGKEISLAASELANATQAISEQESTSVTTKLSLLTTYVEAAMPHINLAKEALEDVDAAYVPESYQLTVAQLKDQVPQLAQSMDEMLTFSDAMQTVLGADRKMRYLLAFQNNTELRATGGFIGSFAEIDVLDGEIVNVWIPEGGTYDVQGQLSAFVEAPEPLSLVNPRWEFHDANWSPDFPTSAQKLLWFYEKSGGPTVDGVVAINASMMPDLLAILGDVEMEEYGRTITAENFLFETQKIVEFEYSQYQEGDEREENAPKQFIGDLAPLLLERMTEADFNELLAIAGLVGEGLVERDVQVYFENHTLQSEMSSLGWTGEQVDTAGDYLMVVNSNIGGGKTDSVIDQSLDLDIEILEDGRILHTLTITKEHRGLRTTLFEGVNNVDYLRVYVPEGARLIEADGFEIPDDSLFEESDLALVEDEDLTLQISDQETHLASGTDIWQENGKTVFGNWMQTAPGETEEVRFVYELPWQFSVNNTDNSLLTFAKNQLGLKELEPYTLYIQKQSGVEERSTTIHLTLPQELAKIWSSETQDGNEDISILNDTDHFLHYLIEVDR